ncbi:ATPase FliI/YscN [gamma proteobacterium HTCC5015]|nr:ATPase FliI/YscN [gamma proteobacterium HTCC5015]
MTDSVQLNDRILLVTGAGSGLGETVSKACAAAGATVVLLGRKVPKLEKVYDDIIAAGGAEPAIYPLDLGGASPEDFFDLAKVLEENFGRLDGLVHNAADLGELTPLELHTPGDWMKTWQINVHSPLFLTQACLPLLRNSDNGSIIFTEHQCDDAYWGAYGESKAAVHHLIDSFTRELDGVPRVNGLHPGPLQSPMRTQTHPGDNIKDYPEMSTIMPAYLSLLSADSDVNGQHIDAQSA